MKTKKNNNIIKSQQSYHESINNIEHIKLIEKVPPLNIIKNELITRLIETHNDMTIDHKINYIRDIIRNTIFSIQNYKRIELFSNNDINTCISILIELFEKTQIDYSNYSDNQINEHLYKIIDKLSIIFCNFGTNYIDDLLFIVFGFDYKNIKYENDILESKFELIKKYLHPVSYKIIKWSSKKYKINPPSEYYCENKIIDDIIFIEHSTELECYDIINNNNYNNNLYYNKVFGIRLVFQNEIQMKTIIIQCIVDDVILETITNSYISYRKQHILKNMPKNDHFDQDIVTRMINSMTLKDILICGTDDFYKKYFIMHTDVNKIINNKLDININNFLEMDIYLQRNMLINLFTYNRNLTIKHNNIQENNTIQYTAYLLYDILGVINNEFGQVKQKTIYESFPYKIKEYFKDAMTITIKHNQTLMSKYEINRTTLEQQIYLLKASEHVKEKAMLKLKEIKDKSDDASNKPKQYLEGLLKIPFSIYKEEPILHTINEINIKFISLLNKYDFFYKLIVIKQKYTNIEILNHIHVMKSHLFHIFKQNIKSKIKNANNKQLINSIQFIQTNYKKYDNIKHKTKHERTQFLIEIINHFLDNNKNESENHIMNNYKIYDLLSNPSSLQNKHNENDGINNPINIFSQHNIILSNIENELNNIEISIKSTEILLQNIVKILDNSVYGHFHAKNQILKIIGQWMSGEKTGYCFGFEGSPGIGKTSLAKKGLSKCLMDDNNVSRPFSFISLGGSCNGSTLEGYNYTFANSTWGKIVDILMETKCMNPIVYIDELDKVSKTEHGKEIIGILTHIIDSTQNDIFQDKYFNGIDIDLSKALIIFSYNDPNLIDPILLDRIHRIKFDNLTLKDKLVIVDKYLLPEINTKMGFIDIINIDNNTIEYIIDFYTEEPGVRKLKELLFDLYGEINLELLKCDTNIKIPFNITIHELETKYFKKHRKIEKRVIHNEDKIGIVNGLWANVLGKGGIIPIEAIFYPSSSFLELKLTGLQGDVMKESMNVAKSLAWKLTPDTKKKELIAYFENTKCQGLHINCPDAGINKDGPSAGTAITVALYSLFNNIKISNKIAITGEINLQGEVTAIGGLDLKILGGLKAGIKKFIYPNSNQKDYSDFIEINNNLFTDNNIVFYNVFNIEDVLKIVFD